jgi:cytoskeleton protein RodZ
MNNLSPNDRQTLDTYSGMSVGQIFQKARKAKGFALHDIATHLNIGSTHLEAIEADDVNALPPKVYAVGFVRAYADILELDSEKMAYLFKVQFYGKGQVEQHKSFVYAEGKTLSLYEAMLQKYQVIPAIISALVAAILALVMFVVLVIWLFTPSNRTNQISVPEVPPEMLEEHIINKKEFESPAADEVIVADSEADSPEPIMPAVMPDEGRVAYGADALEAPLAIKAISESWVQIQPLDRRLEIFTRTLRQGDVFYIAEGQDVLFTTGNAGGIEIFLDGESLGVMGEPAQVLRNRPLSVQALRLRNGG